MASDDKGAKRITIDREFLREVTHLAEDLKQTQRSALKLKERLKGVRILELPEVGMTEASDSCAACAACAVCLADGPIPDFEPVAIAGLLGLA